MGSRSKALKLPGGMVLEHIPGLLAIGMPMDLYVSAETRLERAYTIPGRAEK